MGLTRHGSRAARAVAAILVLAIGCGAPALTVPSPAVSATASPSTSAAASAQPTTPPPLSARVEDLVAQFNYDRAAPLQVRETATAQAGTTAVTEIEYANGRGSLAKATLIVPVAQGRRAALVMSPGSNQPRGEMRAEALGIANALGVVALIVDQSQISSGRDKVWTFTAQDREEAIESAVGLLRGVDVLAARADVDPSRVGIYAFSYGASLAVMAAAADRRVGLLVLRSGGPQILRELAGPTRASAPGFAAYQETMASVDQMRFAPAIGAAVPVLVQNGASDTTYPADGVRAWQAAIGGAKVMRMYDGLGHALGQPANDDAIAFIRERWQLR
ncbi:MAG TPA: hypothetical protein VM052_06575 [Candidatus Limnocylindrales bacterium]|nr:hypothetical protein [Candidatus Limnocylindrales bacterium]